MEKKTIPFRLPQHGQCFLCSPNSGSGVEMTFYTDGKIITGKTILQNRHQGPPGHSHGGVLLAILDEAMGAAAWVNGYPVLAAHVEGDFKNPVPLGAEIYVKAWVKEKKGRKVYTEGEITLSENKIAALGKGIFIESKDFFQSKIEEFTEKYREQQKLSHSYEDRESSKTK